jgi:hypothetical protein
MQKLRQPAVPLLTAILALRLFIPDTGVGQVKARSAFTCEHVVLLGAHPISEVPKHTQTILRRAVRSKVQAIIHDPGMAMSDTVLEKVPLKAIEIARTSKYDALYVVAWDDDSFGVNGFNWIVEAGPGGGVNLLSDHASSVAGGFGVKVLGTEKEKYPEIMIASKGFAEGGGAMAAAGCFQKIGQLYEITPCPASCQDGLNP